MQGIINNIGKAIKGGGKFEPFIEYQDIFEKYGCQFRNVALDYYRDYLVWAIWYYNGEPFPVLQCFWPDRDGHYPWDPACAPGIVELQPFLFKPV